MTTAIETHPAVLAHLDEGGVQPDVGVGPVERAGAEALHLGVQLGAQPADLALADPLQPQRLDQVVHPPRRDALHVGLLHHRHQRPLRPRARLQQRGEVAAVAHPRHPQLDRAHPRVPVAARGSRCAAPSARRVRSWRSAPRCWVTSSSISAWPAPAPPPAGSRRPAPASALRSSSASAILSSSAIAWSSSRRSSSSREEPRAGRPRHRPGLLHTPRDVTGRGGTLRDRRGNPRVWLRTKRPGVRDFSGDTIHQMGKAGRRV